jgi:hypothetical protein
LGVEAYNRSPERKVISPLSRDRPMPVQLVGRDVIRACSAAGPGSSFGAEVGVQPAVTSRTETRMYLIVDPT